MHPAILDGFADELVKMATIAQTVASPLRRAAQAAKVVVGDTAAAGRTMLSQAATAAHPAAQAVIPATRAAAGAVPQMGILGSIGGRLVRGAEHLGLSPTTSAPFSRIVQGHLARGAGEHAGVQAFRTIGKGAVGVGATGVGLGGLALHHAGQPAQAQLTEKVTR